MGVRELDFHLSSFSWKSSQICRQYFCDFCFDFINFEMDWEILFWKSTVKASSDIGVQRKIIMFHKFQLALYLPLLV